VLVGFAVFLPLVDFVTVLERSLRREVRGAGDPHVFLYDFLMLGFLGQRVRLEAIENCDGSSIEVVFIYTVAAQHFLTLPHTFYTVQRCPALPIAS